MEELISVCIITYNSAHTVVETLESIKRQSYKKIELIVSDDASKDSTQSIVLEWITNNKSRFFDAKLISADCNHGTAINLSSAITNSSGKWIKILAGDDLLSDDCLEVFMNHAAERPDCLFFVSRVKVFSENSSFDLRKIQRTYDNYSRLQYKSMQSKKHISGYRLIYPGPAWFFSRELYNEVGGLDKQYSMLDETPFTFKVVQNDYEILPVSERLVLYRVSPESSSRTGLSAVRRKFMEQDYDFFVKYQVPYLKRNFLLLELWDQKIFYWVQKKQILKAERTGVFDSKLMFLHKFLSPLSICSKLMELLCVR